MDEKPAEDEFDDIDDIFVQTPPVWIVPNVGIKIITIPDNHINNLDSYLN